MEPTIATSRQNLDSRLDRLGWGIFFLMSGAVLLVPGLPQGSWMIGLGAILLGFSAVRFMAGLPVSATAVVLGIVAFASGAGESVGITVPWFSLLLILCGLALAGGELAYRVRRA